MDSRLSELLDWMPAGKLTASQVFEDGPISMTSEADWYRRMVYAQWAYITGYKEVQHG